MMDEDLKSLAGNRPQRLVSTGKQLSNLAEVHLPDGLLIGRCLIMNISSKGAELEFILHRGEFVTGQKFALRYGALGELPGFSVSFRVARVDSSSTIDDKKHCRIGVVFVETPEILE